SGCARHRWRARVSDGYCQRDVSSCGYLNVYGLSALRRDRGASGARIPTGPRCGHQAAVGIAPAWRGHGLPGTKLETLAYLYVALAVARSGPDTATPHVCRRRPD